MGRMVSRERVCLMYVCEVSWTAMNVRGCLRLLFVEVGRDAASWNGHCKERKEGRRRAADAVLLERSASLPKMRKMQARLNAADAEPNPQKNATFFDSGNASPNVADSTEKGRIISMKPCVVGRTGRCLLQYPM